MAIKTKILDMCPDCGNELKMDMCQDCKIRWRFNKTKK